jgi:hypothetical protein
MLRKWLLLTECGTPFAIVVSSVIGRKEAGGDTMNDLILWSMWYLTLGALPLVMTRMLIKNAMARAVTRRRVPSFMKRR